MRPGRARDIFRPFPRKEASVPVATITKKRGNYLEDFEPHPAGIARNANFSTEVWLEA